LGLDGERADAVLREHRLEAAPFEQRLPGAADGGFVIDQQNFSP
jgi:hypothetical protein